MKKLSKIQHNRLEDARRMARPIHEQTERLVEQIGGSCKCEDNPDCPVCWLFKIVVGIPEKMDLFRKQLDRTLLSSEVPT